MILAEEANGDGAEDVKAAGHPCYDDLLEENKYLRSEVSRFYEEVVILPTLVEENSNINAIRPIEFESFVTEQKSSFKNLLSKFKALEIDFDHLQSHSSQQAIESKRASRTIGELQYELNAANAELLQILPLRLKLTESNKKVENLRRDSLATGEQLSNTQLEKHVLLSKLDRSRSSLEDMQNSLKKEVSKAASSDEKIKGKTYYLNGICVILVE
jgi:predicted  nucleic acid-binding Zn-ribbon protein